MIDYIFMFYQFGQTDYVIYYMDASGEYNGIP